MIARYPSYADRVRAHRGSLPSPGDNIAAQEFPIWTRDDQRNFFSQQTPPGDLGYAHQTSGSTAKPIWFYVTRESYEWRTAIMDRSYSWGRAEEGSRSVHVWAGDQKARSLLQNVKRSVHLGLQQRRMFDAFREFGDTERADCCDLINRFKPAAIVGYTGMLVDLALFARDNTGALRWKSPTMISAAEGLQSGQRELLESYLVDSVFMSYGSREFMSIGMECEHHNGFHLATDNLTIEVVDDDGKPMPPGETGRIVISDLRNTGTPFIRYEIGDYGTMAPADEPCPCGRPFPRLASVDGRLQDMVITPDGGRITGLYITYTMRQFEWIDGYQVVQDDRSRILVRLLCAEPLTPERTAPVEDLLRKKVGERMEISFARVPALERRATGKVALIISSVTD